MESQTTFREIEEKYKMIEPDDLKFLSVGSKAKKECEKDMSLSKSFHLSWKFYSYSSSVKRKNKKTECKGKRYKTKGSRT